VNYFYIFIEFFQTGLFAIGGGLATVPFVKEAVSRQHWMTNGEMSAAIAAAQSLPGPFGVNLAVYVGYSAGGVFGGAVAMVALTLPTLICAYIVMRMLEKWKSSRILGDMFYALRPCTAGMIASVILPLFLTQLFDGIHIPVNVQCAVLYAVLVGIGVLNEIKRWKLPPVLIIATGAAVGLLFFR
jgi:chromate transporter